MIFPLLLALLACKKAPTSEPAPLEPAAAYTAPAEAPPPPPQPAPTPGTRPDGVEPMIRALASRDAAPRCETVEANASDPVAALRYIADNVPMPPQAGMRAATCLVDRHAEAAAADLVRWVGDESTQGLGRLVIQRLGTLPEPVAHDVAAAALAGPLRDDILALLRASPHESVRALDPSGLPGAP